MDKKLTFNIKDIIYLLTIVISMTAGYYSNKTKTDEALRIALECKKELKDNNLELINYKLDEILKALN